MTSSGRLYVEEWLTNDSDVSDGYQRLPTRLYRANRFRRESLGLTRVTETTTIVTSLADSPIWESESGIDTGPRDALDQWRESLAATVTFHRPNRRSDLLTHFVSITADSAANRDVLLHFLGSAGTDSAAYLDDLSGLATCLSATFHESIASEMQWQLDNRRRVELILRDIDSELVGEDSDELEVLQRQAEDRADRLAPRPTELLDRLTEKYLGNTDD